MERLAHTHSDDRSELLSAYSDNAVDVIERRRIEDYIQGCRACAQELRELRMFKELLGSLPHMQPPRSFTLDPRSAPRPKWLLFPTLRLASLMAALLLVVVLGVDGLSSLGAGAGAPTTAMQQRSAQQAPPAGAQFKVEPEADTGGAPEAAFAPLASEASNATAAAAAEAAPAGGEAGGGVAAPYGAAGTGSTAAGGLGDETQTAPEGGEAVGADTVTLNDGSGAADNATPSPFDTLLLVELVLALVAVAFGLGALVAWRRGI